MITLLIIADDFTGALDTGVKFAEKGTGVYMTADYQYEFEKTQSHVQVLVLDAETRHLSADQAYQRVYHIVKRARKAGIPLIYKKTDSALRGNVGSELRGMLDAGENSVLHFVPAFPRMGRITVQGIQYIQGIPVSESVFGRDPFEPVTVSSVKDLIHQQGNVPVEVIEDGTVPAGSKQPVIAVYDAETDEEIRKIAVQLKDTGQLGMVAGCAGLAEALPDCLKLKTTDRSRPYFFSKFLVVCGSVNPVTKKQIAYARDHGFRWIGLKPEEVLTEGFLKTRKGIRRLEEIESMLRLTDHCIIDTNDRESSAWEYAAAHGMSKETLRGQIADSLGNLVRELLERGLACTLLITGGDSLMGFMKFAENRGVVPIEEVAAGVVLSEFKMNGNVYNILSKSGGFGEEDLFVELAEKIRREYENETEQARRA